MIRVCRLYVGVCLIVVARTVIAVAQAVDWLGRALVSGRGVKGPESVSQGRVWHVVPYTVRTAKGTARGYRLERWQG